MPIGFGVGISAPFGGDCLIDNSVMLAGAPVTRRYSDANLPTTTLRVSRTSLVSSQGGVFFTLRNPSGQLQPGQTESPVRAEISSSILNANAAVYAGQENSKLPIAALDVLVRREFQWHGHANLYDVFGGSFLQAQIKGPSPVNLMGLAKWKEFWGTAEPGSIEGQVRFQGGDLLGRLQTAPAKLTPDDYRLRPDSPGYRAGPDGKDLGADIDLVGPGAAYERWQGTPEYQAWCQETRQPLSRAGERSASASALSKELLQSAEAASPPVSKEIRRFNGHEAVVWSVAFSPDGSRALSGSGGRFKNGQAALGTDFTARLWDVATGQQLMAFTGHRHQVQSVAFSADGKQVVGACKIWAWRRWDVETGQELTGQTGDPGRPFFHLALSADAKRLLSWGGKDKVLRLWDVAMGTEIWNFDGLAEEVSAAAFSSDGQYVATAGGGKYDQAEGRLKPGSDHSIRVWNAVSGKEASRLRGHNSFVRGLEFLPDGRRLLSGGADNVLRLWDLQTGQELKVYPGHSRPINALAVSHDGRWAITGSADSTVRLWDVETGKELCRYVGHTGELRSVAISPDGRYALSGGYDEIVRLWQLPELEK